MLLFIDNFDSFTYTLVHCFQILGVEIQVRRGHSLSFEECDSLSPRYLVIGPGPGAPSQAIVSKQLILAYAEKIPILGICLGHQILAELYGGVVARAKRPMHGKTSKIFHSNQGIFRNLPQSFTATRYHSLIVDNSFFPSELEITAWTEAGEIMALRHRSLIRCEGIQFHPESILSEHGLFLLENFITQPLY